MRIPYVEAVFTGTLEDCERWFDIWRSALGEWADRVYFSEKVGIHGESRVHRVLEKLHLTGYETHVLVPVPAWPALRNAAAAEGARIKAAHEVIETRFEFHFVTYNRDIGKEIDGLLHHLPEDVELTDFDSSVEEHPEDADGGMYAAAHPYQYEGGGTFRGPVESLVQMHELAEKEPLMELDEIQIVLGRDMHADADVPNGATP